MVEEYEVTPPCRILYKDHKPCDEVVTVRKRFNEDYTRIDVSPPPKTVYLPRLTQGPGRPRVEHPVKPKVKRPGIGRHCWNKRDDITVDKIIKMQKQGMIAEQIGEFFGVSKDTIFGRLRKARRSDVEAAQVDAEMRRCPKCGGPKWATHAECNFCRAGRKSKVLDRASAGTASQVDSVGPTKVEGE